MKHISTLLLGFVFLLIASGLSAQGNVGIGVITPDPSSILELQSTDKGILIPRLSAIQRNAITTPATGLMVYDTDSSCFYFYKGTWTSLCGGTTSGGGGGSSTPNTALAYDSTAQVLSITDAAGTLTTPVPLKNGRWAVSGTTNIQTTSANYTNMPGTSITFTPTTSKVYIIATASGDADMAGLSPLTPAVPVGGLGVRLKDQNTNQVLVGASSIINTPSFDFSNFSTLGFIAIGAVSSWNCSMTTEMDVIPGTTYTLVMDWAVVWTQSATFPARCRAAAPGAAQGDPDRVAHRNIVIWE